MEAQAALLTVVAGYLVAGAMKPDREQLGRRLRPSPKGSARAGERIALLFASVLPGGRSFSKLGDRLERQILFELPDFIDLMALGLRAGDDVHGTLVRVLPRVRGEVAVRFKALLASLELGASLNDELMRLASSGEGRALQEFCNKLAQAVRRGTPLANVMSEQAESVRAAIRNELLRQAGKNETRMLVPLVFLILPVTVVFAVFPSLQLLQLGLF